MVTITLIDELRSLEPGDHIAVKGSVESLDIGARALYRFFSEEKYYYHHGIYIGSNTVVDFYGETKKDARPRKVDIRKFDRGVDGNLYRIEHDKILERHETIKKALSVVRDYKSWPAYDVISNNCETFATWLKTGFKKSAQVTEALSRVFKWAGPLRATSVRSCQRVFGVCPDWTKENSHTVLGAIAGETSKKAVGIASVMTAESAGSAKGVGSAGNFAFNRKIQ